MTTYVRADSQSKPVLYSLKVYWRYLEGCNNGGIWKVVMERVTFIKTGKKKTVGKNVNRNESEGICRTGRYEVELFGKVLQSV